MYTLLFKKNVSVYVWMALTMKSVEVFLFISTFLKNAMQNARDFALSTEGIYVLMHALPG